MLNPDMQSVLLLLKEHEKRITALEGNLSHTRKAHKIVSEDLYSGPSGGIKLLVKDRFFDSKRTLADVRAELTKRDYFYSRQSIHEALKAMTRVGGSLVTLNEGKRKVYANRK